MNYIKREDALDAVLFALAGTGEQSKAIYAVKYVPTADVEEVRHGEWKTIPDYSHALTTYLHICSECKTTYKDVRPKGHNYCHICGAKMDGERSEE